jgi:hypothetical protein
VDGGEGVDAPKARQNWVEMRIGRRQSNGVRRRYRGTATTRHDSGWDELTTMQARQGEGYAARSTSRRQLARRMRAGRAGGRARGRVALARH